MEMSEDHIFRTSIRHSSRFQQNDLNFLEVLPLTYIVRSYKHDREHVAASEGLPQSFRPIGELTPIN